MSSSSTVLRSVRSDVTLEAATLATRCELSCPRPAPSKFNLRDEVSASKPSTGAGRALAIVSSVLSVRRAAS